MSKRSAYNLVTDMLEAIESIRDYSTGLDYELFLTNRMVRDYFGLDYEIIWRIITVHLPPLQQSIKQILENEPLEDADIDPL